MTHRLPCPGAKGMPVGSGSDDRDGVNENMRHKATPLLPLLGIHPSHSTKDIF